MRIPGSGRVPPDARIVTIRYMSYRRAQTITNVTAIAFGLATALAAIWFFAT
jgi:hypothetical protein